MDVDGGGTNASGELRADAQNLRLPPITTNTPEKNAPRPPSKSRVSVANLHGSGWPFAGGPARTALAPSTQLLLVKDSLPLLAAAPAAQNKAAVANALALLPHVGKGGQNEKRRLAGCGLSPTVSQKFEPKWLRAKSYAVNRTRIF